MEQQTTQCPVASSPTWEHLETWRWSKMREWLQELLEAEVDELLGRRKSARRKAVDSVRGYRSGHGKPRRLTLSCGTVTVRRPRVRGVQERFASRLLPLFARRTPEVNVLLPELYLHGLALGDVDLALRGLLGEDAPLSAATVSRLKERRHAEQAQWARHPLADLEVVYLWVDGVYVKAGVEKEKAAVLVVLVALRDARKELVTLVPGHRESTEAWSAVLRDLNARGLVAPKLVIGDGHLGIWASVRNVWILTGVAFLAISLLLWLVVLSRAPLSLAVPMTAVAYVLNAFAAKYILLEAVSALRWTATGAIALGVLLLMKS